jgi:hypothetical protein
LGVLFFQEFFDFFRQVRPLRQAKGRQAHRWQGLSPQPLSAFAAGLAAFEPRGETSLWRAIAFLPFHSDYPSYTLSLPGDTIFLGHTTEIAWAAGQID